MKFAFPIADISGSLLQDYYVRHINGKVFLSKKPTITKPKSQKQLLNQQLFAERVRNGTFRTAKPAQ